MYSIFRKGGQHIVNSPRKTATPLKHKRTVVNGRQPIKRRRLGSTAFAPSRAINTSDTDEWEQDHPPERSRNRQAVDALQTVNRSLAKRRDGQPSGKSDHVKAVPHAFASMEVVSSPKKRKRVDQEDDPGGEKGSWVETEEDEEEPEFIAESQ